MKKLNTYSNTSLLIAAIIMMTSINLFSQGKGKKNLNTPAKQMLQKPGADASKDYCIPYADCSYGDGFEIFVLEEIENLDSGCSPDGYGDFTDMQTPLTAGVPYIIWVVCLYGENNMSVWIDFNDDEVFAPDEMLVDDFFLADGGEVYDVPVTIPSDAFSGLHRLRARANYMESASNPCADFMDGETEDYTVEIIGAGEIIDVGVVSIDIPNTVAPGNVPTLVTLKNYGNTAQTFIISIVNEIYGTSTWVNDLLPGEERQISYGDWYLEPGTYEYFTYFSLDGDENESNNSMIKTVLAQPSVTAFGYTTYTLAEATGSIVKFNLNNPGTINLMATATTDAFLSCACWYNDIIFAIEGGGGLYTIDPTNGTITFVAPTSPYINGIAYDGATMFSSTTTLVSPGVFESKLWEINPVSGEETLIGSMGLDAGTMIGIACDGDGNLYGYDITNDNFQLIDKTTGDASIIGNLGFDFIGAQDMSFNKETNACYLAGHFGGSSGLYKVDIATGGAFFMGEFQDGMEITAFVIPDPIDLLPPENLETITEGNSVFLSWDTPSSWAIDAYNIYRDGQMAGITTETNWPDLCLLPGEYVYTVASVFKDSTSGHSAPANAIIYNCNTLQMEESFEAYNAGEQLVVQADSMGIEYWHCWSTPAGSVEDPFISDTQVFEGNNSLLIEGLNDVAMDLGAKTEGKYAVTFRIYVPSGFDGFFGIWKEVSSGSYGMEAYFNEDETGFAFVGNSEWKAFTYNANTWNDMRALIDLDNDWAKLYINNTMVCQAQWSLYQNGDPGSLKLDVVDFYAGVLWEGTPKSFVDNIEFKQIIDEALAPENLEALVDGNDVLLSWDAPMEGIIEYIIQRNGDYLVSTTDLSFIDEGLEPGEYEYEVIALYGDCASMPAGPVVATVHPTQIINIPAGWSGISSCINPLNPDIESVFQPIIDQLVILQSETGMYWPGENLNSLVNWDAYSAYKIKVEEDVSLTFYGTWVSNKTVQLAEGWNLIPVLCECDVDVVDLFSGLDVVLVKGVAGSLIYWSEYGINSLEFLLSGKAYFVLMGSAGEIVFPECANLKSSTLSGASTLTGHVEENLTGSQDLSGFDSSPTPISHTIAIPTEVIDKSLIGNFLCAFNQNDFCCGCVFLAGNSDAITIYGDDPTTPELDGFIDDDPIFFKIVKENIDESTDVDINFDPKLPQHDGLFATDGTSAVQNLKIEATGIHDKQNFHFNIYPNPASDYVCVDLQISGKLELLDMHGKLIKTLDVNQGPNQLNISMLEQGMYLTRISAGNTINTQGLIIR